MTIKINRLISEVRSKSFSNANPGDSGKMWKLIRKITNYNGDRDNVFASLDFDPDIVNKINDHFSRLGEVDEVVRESLTHRPSGDVIHVSERTILHIFRGLGGHPQVPITFHIVVIRAVPLSSPLLSLMLSTYR